MDLRGVANSVCEIADAVSEVPRDHPRFQVLNEQLMGALSDLVAYAAHCKQLREPDERRQRSARYWLSQGEGSRIPDGLRFLVHSVTRQIFS